MALLGVKTLTLIGLGGDVRVPCLAIPLQLPCPFLVGGRSACVLKNSRPKSHRTGCSRHGTCRTGPGNAIFSRDPYSWHRYSGPEYIKEVIGQQNISFFFR